ncbi:PPOX class F420-dependent oxidoreductase [Actinoplanes siamensis]|uniref:PPOX class F420-dependent oxidoreductase n=1 Tax=Actinoplanes siamensis TaxID=1223317 RepID=A0A919N5I7_9ACTN|nr:PPOX class F420-dependent oxidoreductase [Actinoplanes siamensis]GIF04726.1 PPOX class F420-dependent oxidoreductase [Actinoplanes siamensis]
MTLSAVEIEYLAGQILGRLATVQPDGSPQVNPVGFRWNAETRTIDIGGHNMAASRKFRNVADNGKVAFVVDDVPSTDPWRVRCLEIRGRGEAITEPEAIIRIHPRRILAFGLDEPDRDPHRLTVHKRDVLSA